jgi:hypothetical protein
MQWSEVLWVPRRLIFISDQNNSIRFKLPESGNISLGFRKLTPSKKSLSHWAVLARKINRLTVFQLLWRPAICDSKKTFTIIRCLEQASFLLAEIRRVWHETIFKYPHCECEATQHLGITSMTSYAWQPIRRHLLMSTLNLPWSLPYFRQSGHVITVTNQIAWFLFLQIMCRGLAMWIHWIPCKAMFGYLRRMLGQGFSACGTCLEDSQRVAHA